MCWSLYKGNKYFIWRAFFSPKYYVETATLDLVYEGCSMVQKNTYSMTRGVVSTATTRLVLWGTKSCSKNSHIQFGIGQKTYSKTRGVVSTATTRLVLEEEEWYGLVFNWLGMETDSITRGVVLTTAPRPALGKKKSQVAKLVKSRNYEWCFVKHSIL